jgi:hypothetical protein
MVYWAPIGSRCVIFHVDGLKSLKQSPVAVFRSSTISMESFLLLKSHE